MGEIVNQNVNTVQMTLHENKIKNGQLNQPNVLRLVKDLCVNLSNFKIKYCHWKSNAAIDRSASG